MISWVKCNCSKITAGSTEEEEERWAEHGVVGAGEGQAGALADAAPVQRFARQVPQSSHEILPLPLGHKVLRNLEVNLGRKKGGSARFNVKDCS